MVKVQHKRTLRSSQATRLQIPLEKGTFQDATATHYKALAAKLRQCTAFKSHSFFPLGLPPRGHTWQQGPVVF